MPIYEFRCQDCGLQFEKMKPMSTHAEGEKCPECGEMAQKLVSATNHTFNFPASQMRGMAPPNTGTSIDYNVDRVVGRDAEQRWRTISDRQKHKVSVIQDNPGKTGFDLSRTHDGDYRVMASDERRAVETARRVHRTAMNTIEATKKSNGKGEA